MKGNILCEGETLGEDSALILSNIIFLSFPFQFLVPNTTIILKGYKKLSFTQTKIISYLNKIKYTLNRKVVKIVFWRGIPCECVSDVPSGLRTNVPCKHGTSVSCGSPHGIPHRGAPSNASCSHSLFLGYCMVGSHDQIL